MTNRRSLQTSAQRDSRAFQFIPGHVSGRVASAQPIRERASVGAASQDPPLPPDYVEVINKGAYGGATPITTMGAAPAGVTSGVIMYAYCGYTGVTPPAGWSVAHSGSLAGVSSATGPVYWMVLTTGAIAEGVDPTFTLGSLTGKTEGTVAVAMYFVGGDAMPRIEVGPATATTDANLNTVLPSGATRWAYFGVLRSLWTGLTSNVSGIGVVGNAVIGRYSWPAGGTYSGAAFDTAFTQIPPVSTPHIDWSTIGALGPPGSQSFAVGFGV